MIGGMADAMGEAVFEGVIRDVMMPMMPTMPTVSITMFLVAVFLWWNVRLVVPPGERAVYWTRWGAGAPVFYFEQGTYYINLFKMSPWTPNPFQSLLGDNAFPVPGTRVLVDPPRIEIRTKDGVPGTVDVALEATVCDWSAVDMRGQLVGYRETACTRVNQWISRELAELDANQVSSYATVVATLNATSALERLNVELKSSKMQATRISVDPSGIKLDATYAATVTKQIEIQRGKELEALEADAATQREKNRAAIETMRTEHECQQSNARSGAAGARIGALLARGLSPQHVANILCAEIGAQTVAKAERVFVGLPSGCVGLRGSDGVAFAQEGA